MSNYAGISRAVSARLLADSAITAITGQRIRPDMLDQGEQFPGITYRLVAVGADPPIDGDDDFPAPQFEIACWANDRDTSCRLADAVIDALGDEGPDTWSPSTGDVSVAAATLLEGRWLIAEDVDGGNKPDYAFVLTFEIRFYNS